MSWFKAIVILFLMIIVLIAPSFVLAQFGIDEAAQGTDLIQSTQSIPELIGSIIGIALSFVGVVFFLLILYAGIRWMTAFGNDEKVTSSKTIMENAAIGLVIVLAAYAISKFVFDNLKIFSDQSVADSSQQADVIGCCINPTTGNQIENLKSQCVPNAQNPRTWKAGPCVVGCCYITVAGSCTPEGMPEVECQLWGNRGSWQPGECEASCP